MFVKASKVRYYSNIRDQLRSNSIFIKKDGSSITINLIEYRDR